MPNIGILPLWPLNPDKDSGPSIVVGEVHHPVKAVEIRNPSWLVIPERGLYTGVAIFGAAVSGKTSACMHPFAEQILSWRADDPQRRTAALVLEVKGDFCHDIRQILVEAGRAEDYIELGMDGSFQWNPLSATWLDSYSLAYTVSSLLNQLFGKGKDPFWQQAYTNLVRWIIELYRVFPGRVGHTAAGLSLRHRQGTVCDQNQGQAEAYVRRTAGWRNDVLFPPMTYTSPTWTRFPTMTGKRLPIKHENETYTVRPLSGGRHPISKNSKFKLSGGVDREPKRPQRFVSGSRPSIAGINTTGEMIDNKIRSSIVEGISVFLSIFDLPNVALVFCPPPPPQKAPSTQGVKGEPKQDEQPGLGTRVCGRAYRPSMS